MEIQGGDGAATANGALIESLLYPDHLLYEVGNSHGHFTLSPFSLRHTDEAAEERRLLGPIDFAPAKRPTKRDRRLIHSFSGRR